MRNTKKQAGKKIKGNTNPLVSVIIPACNEEQNIPEVYNRLVKVIEPLESYRFEMLLIDNASVDGTEKACMEIVQKDERWRYVRFSRNFTAEASLAAGMEYARGDALIFLFSDLQDPPEKIPDMLAKWREGYDVVYGKLEKRGDRGILKSLGARMAYRLIYWLSDVQIPPNATDFRLISRPVIEALKRCDERNRYMRGLIFWMGFKQASFTYERAQRARGKSSAGLLFCIQFAITALIAFSTKPLRFASIIGLILNFLSFVGAIAYAIVFFLHKGGVITSVPPPGWTTITLLILFFGGMQFLFMGILGEYLGNVYTEVKRRPLWVIHRTAGFPPDGDPLEQTKGKR